MEILPTDARSFSISGEREFKGSGQRFQNGDTLLARITPCLENGKTAYVNCLKDGQIAHGSTEYIVLSGKEGISDNLFAYYLVRTPKFKTYAVGHMAGTSGRQRVPSSSVSEYELSIPGLIEQKAIASILGALDDKIEVNQKMNRTLEEITRTIFKSWFVDFDPVRAKMEGRPTGLPSDISDLFPDELVDSELGQIPKGWKVGTVKELGKVVCGKTPPTKNPNNFGEKYPFITIPDIRTGGIINRHTERYISEKGATFLNGKLLPAGSVCVSCIATPGLVTLTTSDSFTNQQINSIIPKSPKAQYFSLLTALRMGNQILSSGGGGSVFLNLNTSHFKELPVLLPEIILINAFSDTVESFFKRIELCLEETTILTSLRDTLLPKLISGEVRVPDAEKFLEETTN